MHDMTEIELDEGFRHLARHREQLARANDAQIRTNLQALIRETEEKLARLRLEAYSPLLGGRA
jgi:hypothetical protein